MTMKIKSKFNIVFFSSLLLGVIVSLSLYVYPKISNKPGNSLTFIADIPPSEQKKIYYLIDTMANTGVFGLAFKQGSLKRVGKEISHIPPLEFLAVIFSDPYLSRCMLTIQRSSLKYNHFIEGMQKNMMIQHQSGALKERLPLFSRQVGINHSELSKRMHKSIRLATKKNDRRAFKPFIDYLIVITNQKKMG